MTRLRTALNRAARPIAGPLHRNHMERLGIARTRRLAQRYNRLLYGRYLRYRKAQYERHLQELLEENGFHGGPIHTMEDGWVLDTSGSLPYLEELLVEAEAAIERYEGDADQPQEYRAFFRNLGSGQILHEYPSFLKFALSSEVLSTVCRYFGYIPCLSRTLPPGVRLMVSSKAFDPDAHLPPRDSQLFHMDPYSAPTVYVIILLRDVTAECGPFTWLSESVSQRAAEQLDYWSKGHPYRLSDEAVYSVVDPKETHVLTYPKGTVLFIDPSRCLHYGSREAVQPRYQMFCGYVSPCRADFSEVVMGEQRLPRSDSDSRLRRMLLDKTYMG